MIVESTADAPLAAALSAWAGGHRIVPAAGGVVLLLGSSGGHGAGGLGSGVGSSGERAARFRPIPGGIPGATLAIDAEPAMDVAVVDLLALPGVRLTQSEWLLNTTLARLRRRHSAGQPLATHTHLRLRLAEAATRLAEAAAAAGIPGATGPAHRAISRADEILAELHGGSSVLTDSPGHLARFSALLALAFAGVM